MTRNSTVQYTVSAPPEPAAQALVTIDGPQVVLAVDPLYKLMEFALSPFKGAPQPAPVEPAKVQPHDDAKNTEKSPAKAGTPLSYRVEILRSTVLILESDSEEDAQVIELEVRNIVVAQQVSIRQVGYLPFTADANAFLGQDDPCDSRDRHVVRSDQQARHACALPG